MSAAATTIVTIVIVVVVVVVTIASNRQNVAVAVVVAVVCEGRRTCLRCCDSGSFRTYQALGVCQSLENFTH